MRIYKNYQAFLEAFLSKDKEQAINSIISYIYKKTQIDLNPYDELFDIQRDGIKLVGQLFLSVKSEKAIRINWLESENRSEINSIDIWNRFEFDSNPNYTLLLNNNSVVNVLDSILNFFNNPESLIRSLEDVEYSPEDELRNVEGKFKRARSSEKKAYHQRRIDELNAIISKKETVKKETDIITQDDLKIDLFKAIELYTMQVAKGKSNSLIISGMPGIGKSQTVKDTLKSMNLYPDVHYYWATGTATTAGLYELLFKFRDTLIVFDDCDAVFKEGDSVNLLKNALDTYEVRELGSQLKNKFDSTGMSDKDIQEVYDKNPLKLPNRFEFRGQIIFISNLSEDKFDDALISRSLHVDVHLDKNQIIERMIDIMKKILPSIEFDVKKEALDYLIYITDNYPVKFDLNIRTLIHSINLRVSNNDVMVIGGKSEEIWKLLMRKYLIKSRK